MAERTTRLSRRGRRLRWTISILVGVAVVGAAAVVLSDRCSRPGLYRPGEQLGAITESLSRDLPPEAPEPRFRDVTADAGLGAFRSFQGHRTSQLPEDMGSGAAWGDYDNDGDEDLVLVASGGALDAPASERAPTELYENLGDGSFRQVEDFPETRIIGMAAAWGDCDGDGWLDLIVTGYGSLVLYRNDAGVLRRDAAFPGEDGYWAGAAWGDYDNDRDLDLYVTGYVRYVATDADRARVSRQYGKAVPYTLNPSSYRPERNLLFRNEGECVFTEVAEPLGVQNTAGRSLGALWHDLDDDGWLDLYVANDISDNVLFHNVGGKFEEISHSAWVADYRGAMGLAAGDWNRDGDDDLFVSHWIAQENALYDSQLANRVPRQEGGVDAANGEPPAPGDRTEPAQPPSPVQFVDVADQRGLGQIALRSIGWGAEFVDFDADGWLDLVVANGSTFETEEMPRWLRPQRAFLFWNGRGKHFHDLAPLNETLAEPRVGRGLAVADYDNDGDPDLLFVNHGDGVRLLRNDVPSGRWVRVRLRSRSPGGEAHGFGDGARLIAEVGGATLRRTVSGASYLSQSSRVVHFGLGDADRVDRLEVRWLGGETATYENLAAGETWEITEGEREPRRIAAAPAVVERAERLPRGERERVLSFWESQRAAMNAVKVEGDAAKAIPLFRRALALDPEHEDALYYLAHCLVAQGQSDEAIALLEKLIEGNPQSHRGYKSLGILRSSLARSSGELAAAAASLARAVAINPEETGALLALGEVELLRGEYDLADERFALATRTNPQAAGGFFLRGFIAWTQGDPERAREMLEQTRRALGPEWSPEGMTSEGDVRETMHVDVTPLSRFLRAWDGSEDPEIAYRSLEQRLAERPGTPAGA